MKPTVFLGSSLRDLKLFPDDARSDAGFQIRRIQQGLEPNDWKPMPSIGTAVKEIRVHEASGAFRVIYVANIDDRVVVLHAFQKKSQKTAQPDIELARARFKLLQRT